VATIRTNRDLYLAVADLIGRHRGTARPLEEYLRALWAAGQPVRDRSALSADEFVGLLSDAFTRPDPSFDDNWRERYDCDHDELPGFDGWEARLVRQVVDLREMRERGILDGELLYFGTDAPRGGRWYNFDPCTFLECGMAGTFGGWQPGDDTGRDYVPGPVAVMGDDGQITSCDPRDVPNPVAPIVEITWDDFRTYLGDGQWYE
jgi:hypothetical protein